MSAHRWWEDPEDVERVVAGVFEGGGAKGVLYAEALQALLEKRCWFDAVAGASAGAITAALVAAGLHPDEISGEMDTALRILHPPTPLRGILRIRAGASYLNQEALIAWLGELLERRLGVADLTFRELHERTGIELDVVAVDLRRERHVVFNHVLTPQCQIAYAVAASAAIPFVFEWMPLRVPGDRLGIVVDGGVAMNFPTFVFTDASFRRWAGLEPQRSPVVGFLLDERETQVRASAYEHATLLEPVSGWPRPGFGPPGFRERGEGHSLWTLLRRALLPLRIVAWPFTALFYRGIPWLLEKNAGAASVSTWDKLRGTAAYPVVSWFDRVLRGTRPWALFGGALAIVTLQLGVGVYFTGGRPLYRVLVGDATGDLSDRVLGLVVSVLVIAAGVYAWTVLVALFTAASVLYAPGRTLGYGLLRTFLWGPGAPPWVGAAEDDHVVKLRVPPGVTTLGVAAGTDLKTVMDDVRRSAAEQLETILARP